MKDSQFLLPINFQALPDFHLLDGVPAQTQVFCIGEAHHDLFHRVWLYNNLKKFKQQGYKTFAIEAPVHGQQNLNYSLEKLDHDFSALKHTLLPDSGRENYFQSIPCALSEYKILHKAKKLGFDIVCVDDSKIKTYRPESNFGMFRRNKYMAEQLAEHAQNNKTIHWVGNAHLYGAGSSKSAQSVQSLLHKKNMNVYSVCMISGGKEVFLKNTKILEKADRKSFQNISNFYRKNFSVEEQKKPIGIDLKIFSKKSGITMPDKMVVFTEDAAEWLAWQNLFTLYGLKPKAEDDLWKTIQRSSYAQKMNISQG